MERNMSILILVLLTIGSVASRSTSTTGRNTPAPTQPPTDDVIYLQGVIRDQAPNTMFDCGGNPGSANNSKGFYNTDFQMCSSCYDNNEWGLCGDECNSGNGYTNCGLLGADFTPVYKFSGQSPHRNVHSPDSFYNWFHTTDQNIPINVQVPLTSSSGNSYVYSNDYFFPIDGQGWSDWCYNDSNNHAAVNKHNFGFCMEAHTRFGYRGGEIFKFFGDDDLWVYIDSKLVIDLGSLHPKASKSVSLDNLPFLTKGNNYRLDFFYCERHTDYSRLELTTGLEFYCTYEDWCGACEGTGQSCCTAAIIKQYCDDGDDCTIDTCGVKIAPGQPGGCVNTPVTNCTAPDQCHQAVCHKQGGCEITPITCNDNSACTTDTCDPSSGCVFTPITCDDNSKCTDDSCDINKGCQFVPKVCNDSNACTVDTCVNASGCVFTPRAPCNDNSKCTSDTCDPVKGCVFTDLCPNTNPCMIRTCDPTQGCSLNAKTCGSGLKCVTDSCNTANGDCLQSPYTCPDLDSCHTTSCSNSSGCSYSTKNCDLGLKCMVYSCNTSNPNGCQAVPRVCEDNNACTQNLCSNSSGCYYPNVTIDDGKACTNDFCDPVKGVYHTAVVCNDSNACTVDSCSNSSGCIFTPLNCDDSDPCTNDGCNPASGCTNVRIPDCTTCKLSGANYSCPITDKCFPQVCNGDNGCKNGTAVDCNDGNACTKDTCTNGVCSNDEIPCEPLNLCETASCDRVNGCVHKNKSCDDGNPCTVDACGTDGNCTHTLLDKFCVVCGTDACPYSDPCNPKSCNANKQCTTSAYSCNDNNACTNDTCTVDNSGALPKAVCSNPTISCADSGDVCNPNVCNTSTGCQKVPVVCADTNKCTQDTCANVGGKATCLFPEIECPNDDPCNPQSCSEADGQCHVSPVTCNDFDSCTNDSCVADGGNATCRNVLYDCGSDSCGALQCNSASGTCISYQTLLPVLCDDGNPCTDDIGSCNGTGYVCNHTLNTLCDDNNVCTNDVCNSQNATEPCSHTNVTCLPIACQVVVGCDHVNGCIYAPLECPKSNNTCKIPKCDLTAGCIEEDLVCTVKDPDCYAPTCDPTDAESPCGQRQRSGWGTRFSGNGELCALRYSSTAKKAAIGTGAAVGIAIGAAAAVGIFGYGGKKGYDMIKMMREQRFDGVQNNPLYEQNANSGDNPLYRYSMSPNT